METSWYVNFYKKRVPCASLSYIDIRNCDRAFQSLLVVTSLQCASVTSLLLVRVKELMLFEGITNTEIKNKCFK